MKYKSILIIIGSIVVLLITGCSASITGNVVKTDDSGCLKYEEWCDALEKCINTWESYCPQEGESVKMSTANECNFKGGTIVNYGGGDRCPTGMNVQGEIVGLLSLHVCCLPIK
jgi:hypothetical protein